MIIRIEKLEPSPMTGDGYLIAGFPLMPGEWIDILGEDDEFIVIELGGNGSAELSFAQEFSLNSNTLIKAWEVMIEPEEH